MEKSVTENGKLLLEHCDDIIIYLSLDNEILALSDTAKLVLGISEQNLLGKDLFKFCDEQNIKLPFNEIMLKSASDGEALSADGEILYPDGHKYVAHWKYIFCQESSPKCFLIIGKDISDLISHRNNVNANKLYLKLIIENLPEYIYWKDKNLLYQGCNKHVAEYLGFKFPEDIIGKTDRDFGWDENRVKNLHDIDVEVIEKGKKIIAEDIIPKADGSQRIMLTNKVPLSDEKGAVIGILGISFDITEMKEAELELERAKTNAEQANKSKSEFLAAVSHELRIPLTGILGMARILVDESMPDKQSKHVHDIIMSGEHLLALVNDLLDLAKLEAGKLELHPSPLNLRKLIEEIATMLSFQAKAKNLDLLVNYAIDAPQMIIGDARAIRQILLNLMGNAVKFTERGHVKIRVECIEQEQLKARLALTVEDTGIGIPPEKLDSVFERFNQVDSSRTRRYGGAGLGLTITKAYVELMSGKIWVESEVGKGSKFICEVPFPLQDMVNRPSIWDPYRSQLRVLVVDDTLRGDVIAKQLACSHCQVVPGPQAFNSILVASQKREPYHIVIIDQQLQSLDAMQLGRQITQHRNLHKPMMVLLMPPSTVEARNSARESGFFETLIKPVQPSELLVGITAAWERWEDNNQAKNKTLSIFSTKQPNILLVEDDPIIQKVHTMMLEKVGCQVSVAQNSQEALGVYNKGFDAIFMDVGLPGMSGIEIAAEIRRREAGLGRIPIIGVTGYGYEEDKINCLNAGMDDVAIKPLKPEELTQLLIKWVAKEKTTA